MIGRQRCQEVMEMKTPKKLLLSNLQLTTWLAIAENQ